MTDDVSLPIVHRHAWHQATHHQRRGFRNVHGEPVAISPLRAMKWLLGRPFVRKQNIPAPSVPLASALWSPTSRLRITWLGHASLLVQQGATNVLVDPMASRRASPLSFAGPPRLAPFPADPANLPPPDVVLLTHDHYDHFDDRTLRTLTRAFDPLFVAPLGLAPLLRRRGARRIVTLDWHEYVSVDGIRVHAVPARHFSGRGLFNRNGTLWTGWHLETEAGTVHLAGDTGYGDHFPRIPERFGAPDVVVMPIGAYEPRWFMEEVHVTPEEAWQATRDLGARHVIPVHWGTFDLADEPLHEPIERFSRARRPTDAHLHILPIGGSWSLDP